MVHCLKRRLLRRSTWPLRRRLAGVAGAATQALEDSRSSKISRLLSELKSCSIRKNLERGRQIHSEVVESGNYSSIYVATALVNMYAKCGSMAEARQVFDNIGHPNVVSWTSLISGYAENGEELNAFDSFSRMKSVGCTPNSITYMAVLKACTSLAQKENGSGSRRNECLEWGKKFHLEIGCHLNLHVQNTLIAMYAKCGSMADARQVFDRIVQPNVISWTTLLLGYAENGEGLVALDLFSKMKSQGCAPDSITYVAALKACSSLAKKEDGREKAEYLERAKQIHSEVGYQLDQYVQNTLIDMYANFGRMSEARCVFNNIKQPDVVSWTSLILGYADNGEGFTALDLFSRMKSLGCTPNSITYVAAVKACASLAQKDDGGKLEWLERGKQIHSEIGSRLNRYVQNTLIDMYAKCGFMVDARQVFDSVKHPDVVSWNVLLSGYAESGEGLTALDLFSKMRVHGCPPNSVTYVAALKACTSLAQKNDGSGSAEWLERGKEIHLKIGCPSDPCVQSALMDMYANCGSMADARQVFDNIAQPNVVSWTTLLLGYAENGEAQVALDLFSKMKSLGCAADPITYVAVLKACGLLGALEYGRKIHAEIIEYTTTVVTCLVDFYAKCGSLVEARKVFDLHCKTRHLATWTALLAAYSSFGETDVVFRLFAEMQDAGFHPDGVTFLCILMCCSHAGLVEKAREFFGMMPAKHSFTPTIRHYNCMVDVLGRANKLDDVIALLRGMPCSPNAVTWTTILGACRKWKNVEIGRLAFQSLVSLDERNGAAYVLMAHIYASRGMWEDQEIVLGLRKKSQAWKVPCQTCWTSETGEVHKLLAGESQHPQIQEIWQMVKEMSQLMKEHGYVADTFSIGKDTDVEKEDALCGHSEKLAIACALINTKPREAIRVVKNHRACEDCHNATALLSKLYRRTISVRDASRFHVFKDGNCSCNDHW